MSFQERLSELCKHHLAISTDRVVQIDEYLQKKWSVHCISAEDQAGVEFFSKRERAYQRYIELIDLRIKRTNGNIESETPEETKAFYSSLCKKPFGSWCMSARRAHVLAGLAAIDGIVSTFKPKTILEFGSGFGFASHWCASQYRATCHGFDFSKDSVDYARSAAGNLTNVTFEIADFFKFKPTSPFDLVFGIAGLPGRLTHDDLQIISEWVSVGGLVLIISPTLTGSVPELGERKDDLHIIYHGATGGYLGWAGPGDYEFQTITLLMKGAPPEGLKPIITDVYETWDEFAKLVNNFPLPHRERNFAYYNSWGRPPFYPG